MVLYISHSGISITAKPFNLYFLNIIFLNFIRWCKTFNFHNLSQTVFLVVEDVSVNDFEESPHLFTESHKIFEDAVEVANPWTDGLSIDLSLAFIPISVSLRNTLSRGCRIA